MPLYDYECSHCGVVQKDVQQSIREKPKKKCITCGKKALQRIIYGGAYVFVSQEPSTIGQLADKNAKKNASKIQEAEHEKNKSQSRNDLSRQLNRMTPQQKRRYIMEGKK